MTWVRDRAISYWCWTERCRGNVRGPTAGFDCQLRFVFPQTVDSSRHMFRNTQWAVQFRPETQQCSRKVQRICHMERQSSKSTTAGSVIICHQQPHDLGTDNSSFKMRLCPTQTRSVSYLASNRAIVMDVSVYAIICLPYSKGKIRTKRIISNEIPIQTWIGPQVSRSLRIPEGGKVVSPRHWGSLQTPLLQEVPHSTHCS